MALNLQLTSLQSNDNKILQFTDNTGSYSVSNTGGWGAPNLDITAINGSTHTLELGIRIVTPNENTTYDYIDLYDSFGPFTQLSNLLFTVDRSTLVIGAVPLGTANETLPDGLYYVTYIVDRGLAGETSLEYVMFVDGNVRNSVYNKLRTIPTSYMCSNCSNKDINDAIFAFAYLKALESTAYVAKTEELLNGLSILERLVIYGSNCSW